MSAQINLYHPRFLKQRDLLTLRHVGLAAAVAYAVLALAGAWAWQNAAERRAAAAAAEATLKALKEKTDAAAKAVATRKADPKLVAEADSAEALLRRRTEIASLLESGAIGSTGGFADFMRGFARQTQDGLWLTGFKIGSGGQDMEIRGSMLNPGALPEYIRRLGGEKAFQGRNFASLALNRAEPAGSTTRPGATAVPVAPTSARPPIDFILMPARPAESEGAKQ